MLSLAPRNGKVRRPHKRAFKLRIFAALITAAAVILNAFVFALLAGADALKAYALPSQIAMLLLLGLSAYCYHRFMASRFICDQDFINRVIRDSRKDRQAKPDPKVEAAVQDLFPTILFWLSSAVYVVVNIMGSIVLGLLMRSAGYLGLALALIVFASVIYGAFKLSPYIRRLAVTIATVDAPHMNGHHRLQ